MSNWNFNEFLMQPHAQLLDRFLNCRNVSQLSCLTRIPSYVSEHNEQSSDRSVENQRFHACLTLYFLYGAWLLVINRRLLRKQPRVRSIGTTFIAFVTTQPGIQPTTSQHQGRHSTTRPLAQVRPLAKFAIDWVGLATETWHHISGIFISHRCWIIFLEYVQEEQ